MPVRAKWIAVGLTVVLLCIVLMLVRRRRLHETYSLLWIMAAAVLVVVSLWTDFLVWLRNLTGAVSANSIIFTLGFLFVFIFLLHVSVRLSQMQKQIRELSQNAALQAPAKPDEPAGDLSDLDSRTPSDTSTASD
jgi:hypothetical protein